MHTNTLYRILSAYAKTGRTVGLSPWGITLSIRAVSEISGVSRNTAAAAITAANGFIQTDDGWKIGKAFKWAELKAHYDNRTPRGALKAWWDSLPEYKGTPDNKVEGESGLSAEEKELVENYRKATKSGKEAMRDLALSAGNVSHKWETDDKNKEPAYINGLSEAMENEDWVKASRITLALRVITKAEN